MARLGHELRTPLNAILGFSELTARETFGPVGNPRYAEYARFIHEGARRMLATLDAIQRLRQLERAPAPLGGPVALAELVETALARRAEDAAARGIALVAGALGRAARAAGDQALLLELVDELLANALAFTPSGGRVEASVARAGGGWVVAVRDSGVGIPAGQRDAVFEPFVRLQPAGVTGGHGPGLGLARARRIAALHGGTLALGAARGGGTVARLVLPRGRAKPSAR